MPTVTSRSVSAHSDATAEGAHAQLAELPPWLAFERRIVKREAGSVLRRDSVVPRASTRSIVRRS